MCAFNLPLHIYMYAYVGFALALVLSSLMINVTSILVCDVQCFYIRILARHIIM